MGKLLRRGTAITVVALVLVQVVSLVQTVVIARLLTPAEIGVFAAGTVLFGFVYSLGEGGLRHALVQRQDRLEDAADTVFWASLLFGLLISLVTLALSPLVSLVIGDATAGAITAVLSGTLLLQAFTNVPDSLLQRRFAFMQRLVVGPSIAISFAIVSIALCATGFGVWGLVIAQYVSHAVWVGSVWVLAKWRPGAGRPSIAMWRELAHFGFPLITGNIVYRGQEMIETFAVGRFLSTTALGHYRYARRLSLLPAAAVIEVGGYVLFPAFSRIAGDPDRLRSAFMRALTWMWFAIVPVTALTMSIGEPLVVLVLGEPWRGAGVALVAMAAISIGEGLCVVGDAALKGIGRSQLINWVTLTGIVTGVGLLVALLPFGLVGVALAVSSSSVICGLVCLGLARGVVDVSVVTLLRALGPPVLASAVSAAAIASLEHLVVHSDRLGVAHGLGTLVLESLAFGMIYLAVMRVIDPGIIGQLSGAVAGFVNRRLRGSAAP